MFRLAAWGATAYPYTAVADDDEFAAVQVHRFDHDAGHDRGPLLGPDSVSRGSSLRAMAVFHGGGISLRRFFSVQLAHAGARASWIVPAWFTIPPATERRMVVAGGIIMAITR